MRVLELTKTMSDCRSNTVTRRLHIATEDGMRPDTMLQSETYWRLTNDVKYDALALTST